MTLPIKAVGTKDQVNVARIRDYWLGGRHHSERDRVAADRILVCAPQMPYLVRQKRALQQRMVRYLIKQGIRQFLSFDAGVPSVGHVHEVAQALLPDARVGYLDRDPEIVRVGRDLLKGNDNATFLHAEPWCVRHVLNHPELHGLIDPGEPLALMMIDTLLFVPDRDDPAGLIAAYAAAVRPGSYLGLAQFSQTQHLLDGLALYNQLYGEPLPVLLREPEQFACLFGDLAIVEPGIVPLPLWHPDSAEDIPPNPERIRVYAGLGRKT